MRQKEAKQVEKAQSAADQAYSGIMDLVLCYDLRPGERTSVNLLAARLKLGRTPVKEAITRLQTEGLLSVSGRSGTMFNRLDRKQAEHLFAVRQVLEGFAAEEAVKFVTAEQLRQLRELLEEMRLLSTGQGSVRAASGFVRANVAFHALIVAAAGNPFLVRLYGQLQMQFQIVTYLLQRGYDPKAAEQRQREHEGIVRALAARDGKVLKAALRLHAQTTETAILAALDPPDARLAQSRNRKRRHRTSVG